MIGVVTAPAILSPASADSVAPSRWYLAEGYTGDGFQEYLCLANPTGTPASISATYLFSDGGSAVEVYDIGPMSRFTVDVNAAVGPDREVSVILESAQADLAVERPIYFDYKGRAAGAHTVVAARSMSETWYFAEGCTLPGFDEYVCVLNPSQSAANLTFRFQTASNGEIVRAGTVPSGARATFSVNELLGPGMETALVLESDLAVVAERPMYFEYGNTAGGRWEGGHCVMGADSMADSWYFAEGTTRPGFDEWLTLQNPAGRPITVAASYQLGPGQGGPVTREYPVGPAQRLTVDVASEVGRDKDVSVRLSSGAPFMAERPVYHGFSRSALYFEGGHCALGSPAAATSRYFAEGYTGPFFEEWLCLQNSTDAPAKVAIDYMTQEMGALPSRELVLEPDSRTTVLVNEHAGPGLQVACGVRVLSGSGIVVERPMYYDRDKWHRPSSAQRTTLHGLCFSPYTCSDPTQGGSVSEAHAASLLNTVAKYSGWIRTFGSRGEWDFMATTARSLGMSVAGGCDIWTDLQRNAAEVAALTQQAADRRVDMAVVGDEVLLCGALPEQQLIAYIQQVRAAGVPAGTSDAWDVWLEHPALVAACDVILVNAYPYWEGVGIDGAAAHLAECYGRVKAVSGGKQVIVETGWPSAGQVVGDAVPSPSNSARYLAETTAWARSEGVPYFYFEAFDEPWKASREGPCGSNWGLWDCNGSLKPDVAGVIAPR